MSKSKVREVRRIRKVLDEIVSLAEDDEMQGGISNVVRRYNAIVRHLEKEEILPPGVFQLLSEEAGAVTFHQVGAESRMLSGYLEEVDGEDGEAGQRPDFGPVIALAPFLEQSDLKALVQSHLSGKGFLEPARDDFDNEQGQPSLRALVRLAPHMASDDLAELVEACLARDPGTDLRDIVALAPHMESEDLGRVLRKYVPGWFDPNRQEKSGPPQHDTTEEGALTSWKDPRQASDTGHR